MATELSSVVLPSLPLEQSDREPRERDLSSLSLAWFKHLQNVPREVIFEKNTQTCARRWSSENRKNAIISGVLRATLSCLGTHPILRLSSEFNFAA